MAMLSDTGDELPRLGMGASEGPQRRRRDRAGGPRTKGRRLGGVGVCSGRRGGGPYLTARFA